MQAINSHTILTRLPRGLLIEEKCHLPHSLHKHLAASQVDYAELNCNLGVASLISKQYTRTCEILEGMFKSIESTDDWLAVRVCLVLLDSLSHSAGCKRASSVLEHLDKLVEQLVAPLSSSRKDADAGYIPSCSQSLPSLWPIMRLIHWLID
jgi:hypothetical protein